MLWDHPRLRGENQKMEKIPALTFGSPPLARGKPIRDLMPLLDVGITPACAGKTVFWPIPGKMDWDHPRLRGENSSKMFLRQTH